MISPYTSINIYASFRATSSIENNYRDLFNEIDKCKMKSQVDILSKVKSINYGNLTEQMVEPFIVVDKSLRKKSDEIRKSLKHKKNQQKLLLLQMDFHFLQQVFYSNIYNIMEEELL